MISHGDLIKENTMNKPQHTIVYEALRKHILEGVYSKGDLLPSENELCATYGVTRPTIRKALDKLVNDGFIVKRKGKGSIVKGTPKGIGILSIGGTTSALAQENLSTKIIIKPEIRPWEEAFSFSISEREKEFGCIHLERLRLINDEPVFYDITKIPNINLPRFTSRNFENKSLFNIMREYHQIEVTGGEQKIQAILATDKLQNYFNVSKDQPIIQLDRKIDTNRPDFSFYSQVFCNADKYALIGTF